MRSKAGRIVRAGKAGKSPRKPAVTASRFRDARALCCLTVVEAAKLLRVTERTIQNWESGSVRVPYAPYKLMRILRGYELPGEPWRGYRLRGDTLWSPEGLAFRASDHRWWSLTCRMAAEFRTIMAARRVADLARAEGPGLGLVPSRTSDTPNPGFQENPCISSVSPTNPRPRDLGGKSPPRPRRLPRHLVQGRATATGYGSRQAPRSGEPDAATSGPASRIGGAP